MASSSKRDCSEFEAIEEETKRPSKVHCKRDSGKEQYDTSIDKDTIFKDFPKKFIDGIKMALDALIDEDSFLPPISLTPLKILMCNAADKNDGYPFSKAYCSVDMYGTEYAFGTIFRKGINILIDMLQRRSPENRQSKYVLTRLLQYLYNMMALDLESLEIKNLTSLTETELTSVLANHLLGKLSTSSSYVIDKQCKGKEKHRNREDIPCPCNGEGCKLSGYFGDTSIGNGLVWHGSMDIIINNEVIVNAQEDDAGDSPGGKSPVEVKVRSGSLIKNHQIIAETIVFSFLQKKKHPESDNFIFPCIGVSAEDMIIYFYDSLHDILLESSKIPLHGVFTGAATGSVNLIAVLVAWLVVNHKYLCDGVIEEMKTTKAGFFVHAESKLSIYKNSLKFGGVGNASQQSHEASKNTRRNRYKHPELEEMKARKRLIIPK